MNHGKKNLNSFSFLIPMGSKNRYLDWIDIIIKKSINIIYSYGIINVEVVSYEFIKIKIL